MPTRFNDDDKPVVQFDPLAEVSPFALFRALNEGRTPLLYDVREKADGRSLAGAEPFPAEGWSPPEDRDVVLFDNEGTAAVEEARRLQAEGHSRVRALFGGLALYEFALDPDVVGEETFLRRNVGGSETTES